MRATSGARASASARLSAATSPRGGVRSTRSRGVRARRAAQPLAAAVARAVVDRDHLVLGERLRRERVEHAASVARGVADRQQHATPRRRER